MKEIPNVRYSCSPSLTGKKSNELLQGGLSSIKSAATSVAKKLDEIKEAISANTTPVKSANGNGSNGSDRHHNHHGGSTSMQANSNSTGTNENDDHQQSGGPDATSMTGGSGSATGGSNRSRRISGELDLWGRLSESRKSSYSNLVPLGGGSSGDAANSASLSGNSLSTVFVYPSLPESVYADRLGAGTTSNSSTSACCEGDVVLELSSCSRCHHCSVLLYDEEILAGWSAEESNVNTTCHACGKVTVPMLNVCVRIAGSSAATTADGSSASADAASTASGGETTTTVSTSVPYLNPLFLRKELESILAQEGDCALAASTFIEEHPIIYWNLVWLMERIDVSTHLPGLSLPKQVRFVVAIALCVMIS